MDGRAAEPQWRLGRLRRRQRRSLSQQYPVRRSWCAARPADGGRQRTLHKHDGPAWRNGGRPGHAGRARLPGARADRGGQLVRALGRELCLRHLVGALCAERGRAGCERAVRAQGCGLAACHPEPGRRLGRSLYELQARLSRLRTGGVHGVSDRLGPSGADGGGRGRPSCRGPRDRLSAADSGHDRPVAAGRLYRRRFPARFLLALSRLSEIFPALGLGTLPQPPPQQCPARGPRHVMILAATGLQRERRIVAGPDIEAVAGGGDHARLEVVLDRLAARTRGIISIGIAGALAPGLRPGSWIVANAVFDDGESVPTDPAWTGRLAGRLPGAARGLLLGANAMVAEATQKAALHRTTGAVAVDMESHIAARVARRHRLPFAAVRV